MNTTTTILPLNQRRQQEENLHTLLGSKKICAPNPYRQRSKNFEYMGDLTKSNVAGEQPH
jgi:hypothetical protein